MTLKITHKHGTTAGTPPVAGDIDVGELAINAADVELYTKDTSGAVQAVKSYFTQSGTGATRRLIESKLRDVASVKDFGAVGDGVTNDYASIQAAIDASDSVYYPSGDYFTGTGQLYPSSDVNISMDPAANIIYSGDSSATPWGLRIQGNQEGGSFQGTGTANPVIINTTKSTIRNFTIDGTTSNAPCLEIRLDGANDIKIHSNTFINGGFRTNSNATNIGSVGRSQTYYSLIGNKFDGSGITDLNAFDNLHHTYVVCGNIADVKDKITFGTANDGVKNIAYTGNAITNSTTQAFYAERNYQTLSYTGNVARECGGHGYYFGSNSGINSLAEQKAPVVCGTSMLAKTDNTNDGVFNLFDTSPNSKGQIIAASRFENFGSSGIKVAREDVIAEAVYVCDDYANRAGGNRVGTAVDLQTSGSLLGHVYVCGLKSLIKSTLNSASNAVYAIDEPDTIIDNAGKTANTLQSLKEFQVVVRRTITAGGGAQSYRLFTLPAFLDGRIRITSKPAGTPMTSFVVIGEIDWEGTTLNLRRTNAFGGGAAPPSGTPFTAESGDLMLRVNNTTANNIVADITVSFDGLFVV